MISLIFATDGDASPLIHLGVDDPDAVRAVLRRLTDPDLRAHNVVPGYAAVEFFRLLSPDEFAEWAVCLESVPAFCLSEVEVFDMFPGNRLLIWNPETWSEVTVRAGDEPR